ncbi:MAG TPA: hypothetical protein VHM27_13870, partial [Rhizomicrobium sp.]|nr:hypothetical protein [Rhizomicrobium sp.]
TATSFDGLSVQLELVQRPDGIWARIRAAGTGATAEQAAATNARAQGRIFRIPDERGRLLLVDRARVLTPPPTMARQGVMAAPRAPGAQ